MSRPSRRPFGSTFSARLLPLGLGGACAAALLGSFGVAGSSGLSSGGSGVSLARASVTASSCPSPGGVSIKAAAAPTTPKQAAVVVYGQGWGHGMGMSQYGAEGAAKLGCGYRTILTTYYHDTSVVSRSLTSPVLLQLASASPQPRLDAQTGSVRWVAGSASAVQPRGTTWTVTRRTVRGQAGLSLHDPNGTRRLFVPNGATLSAQHSGTVVKVRPTGSTSGLVTRWDTARFTGSTSGVAVTEAMTASNGFSAVQKYLMGLGEVPASWPLEALKAQAVAARTYLVSKYSSTAKAYVVQITTADQVYRGYAEESADAALGGHLRAAVVATNNQVVVDAGGHVIQAMYSSSMGGHTENRQYVYGSYGISYLQGVDDSRWDAASTNPLRSWSKGYTKADFAKRFGFDSVSSYSIGAEGTKARLSGVKITGKKSGKTVTEYFTGAGARSRLGLLSTGFVFGN